MYYINPSIEKLHRIFDQNERKDYIRLDLNENPDGLPQEVIDEVLSDITPQFVSQYPETLKFTENLANFLGTDINHICLTNGSAEAIRYIIQVFTSPKGKIVGVDPSYFMFQVYSRMYDREFIKIPYEQDLTMNVDHILSALNPEIQLLILLNPNNPMGNCYNEAEFKQIIETAEKNHITVLIDEAYHYFYPETFINYALNHKHIFVTRTFSKLFSLAGCRLGYVVGWPEGIKLVQKMCTPHNTNAFAMKFADKIISSPRILEQLIRDFNEGREYLIRFLDENGYPHQGEAGNFIFIKPSSDAETLVKRMKKEKGILIKSYAGVGEFGSCLRVSIGGRKTMEKFTAALTELDK